MTKELSDKALLQKVIVYVLGGISAVMSYIAVSQKHQVNQLETVNESNKAYYRSIVAVKDAALFAETKKSDSLYNVILVRADKSFDQLREILDIKNRSSTITIRPKRK